MLQATPCDKGSDTRMASRGSKSRYARFRFRMGPRPGPETSPGTVKCLPLPVGQVGEAQIQEDAR